MNHTFATHEDDLYEGDETYEAGYSKATGGSDIDGDRYCQVTIVDDDELKVVSAWFSSAPADGYTYRTGEWIEVKVKHNGKVAVHGDTLLWFLFSDQNYRRFNYRRGSGSDTLAFGYQVQVGDRNLNHRLSPVQVATYWAAATCTAYGRIPRITQKMWLCARCRQASAKR